MIPWKRVLVVTAHVVFWSWNALFLLLAFGGIAPLVLADLVADAFEGLARWSTVGWASVLLFLPLVVVVAAVTRLRKDAGALFLAFFGIEVPILSLAVLRLFGFEDLHGAAGVTLASVSVARSATQASSTRARSACGSRRKR